MSTDHRASIPGEQIESWRDAALGFADICRGAIEAQLAHGYEVELKPDASIVTSADREAERRFREAVLERFPRAGIIGEEYGVHAPEAALQWVVDPIDGTSEFAAGVPLYGTIIGAYHEGLPVAGVVDHPGLDLRIHAAFGLGTWLGGTRQRLDEWPPEQGNESARLGMPSRVSFLKAGEGGDRQDEGHIFERLSAAFPNCRTFHSCYAHLCGAAGQLDAVVEWDTRVWDLAAAQILVEEAGGAYRRLRARELADGGEAYCVAFGKAGLVERIARTLAPLL